MSQSLDFRAAYNEVTKGEVTYAHKLECKRCGLHFVVYSWNPEWPVITPEEARRALTVGRGAMRGSFRGTPVCPQCGSAQKTAATFSHKVEPSEDPIFRHMSGQTRWLWVQGRLVEVKTEMMMIPLGQLDTGPAR